MPVIYAVIFLFMLLISSFAQSIQDEQSAVRIPLEIYIKAHATGEGSNLDKSFYPEAKIQGIRPDNNKLVSFKFEDYVKTFPGKPAADEAERKRRIESIEITKNAAVAKLVFDYPTVRITDYMLLLKIDGEWKIVNKIAQAEPKQTEKKN
ncbi:MAG: nuclear transport factor 2 family protein [Acidobacteriota bacterium]|nr:nuclear transport factor 2 family protein [Acidobacteriota bacterium]